MLGAILATVITLLVTRSCRSRLPRLYDPAVCDGYILVGVSDPADDTASRIDQALASAPGADVKTIA